ncbi:MAG TPA: hypothetical protein VK152_03245 [Paludibacter sp.]|nr:hypothetical protein [Paludibacter sp.]
MSRISIQFRGISAELVLGNYMPSDSTIYNNWEDFYHYNDLIHVSQLLSGHISEIEIRENDEMVFAGRIPSSQFRPQKSFSPVLFQDDCYLRTECAEEAVFHVEFETDGFDKNKLYFETQDYDMLFKVGNSFLSKVVYNDLSFVPEWKSGKPIGNICVLCRSDNGYLVPIYDAVNKVRKEK